jgi:hypothetical protein
MTYETRLIQEIDTDQAADQLNEITRIMEDMGTEFARIEALLTEVAPCFSRKEFNTCREICQEQLQELLYKRWHKFREICPEVSWPSEVPAFVKPEKQIVRNPATMEALPVIIDQFNRIFGRTV